METSMLTDSAHPTAKIIFVCVGLFAFLDAVPMARGEEITPDTVLDYSIRLVQETIQQKPDAPEPYFALGYVYYRASRYKDALNTFLKGLSIKPNQPDIVQMAAFLYARLNQDEKAVEWYKNTLALEPDAPSANERLGLSLQKLNRMEEATQAFERELQYHPENASTHVYLAERYLSGNRLEDAIRHAEEAQKYDVRYPEPYYLLSRVYLKQGDQEKANAMLKIFQQKKDEERAFYDALPQPTDQERALQAAVTTHIDVGTLWYRFRQDAKSISHFLKALNLDPKNEKARYLLAGVYTERKESDKAAGLFRELLAMNPNDPRYSLGLGLLLADQKRWSEAQGCLEKTLTLSPNETPAQVALARVLINSNQDLPRAARLMESAIQKESTAENYDWLSFAYYVNGRLPESVEAMRTAMTLDPANRTYQARYEKLLSKMNQ